MNAHPKRMLLTGTALTAVLALSLPGLAHASCATSGNIAANCSLTSNTTGNITLNSGVVVTTNGNITIGNTIGGAADADGTLTTDSAGSVITQSADIGINGPFALNTIAINNNTTWNTTNQIIANGTFTVGAGTSGILNVSGANENTYIENHNAAGVVVEAGAALNVTNAAHMVDLGYDGGGGHGIFLGSGAALDIQSGANGSNVDIGTVDGSASNEGTITVANNTGEVQFNKAIGAVNRVNAINVTGNGGAEFQYTVQATNIGLNSAMATTLFNNQINVTGAFNFGADATTTLGDGVTLTGNVTTSTNDTGTLILTDNGDGAGVTGTIGAMGAALHAVTVTGSGSFEPTVVTLGQDVVATSLNINSESEVDLNGSLTGNLNFGTLGATAVLADGMNITGAVDNKSGTDYIGDVEIETSGGNTSTIGGAVGATRPIYFLAIDDTGQTVFTSTVDSYIFRFYGAGTAHFMGNVTSETGINFVGRNGTADFDDGVNMNGDIYDTGGGNGTVNFAGSSTVTGNLGTAGNAITAVDFNGGANKAVSVSGNIVAATTTIAGVGTASVAGNMTGNLAFTADGTYNVATADDGISGTVDNTSGGNGVGKLSFANGGSIGGTLGATHTLDGLTLGGTNNVTVGGNTKAATTNTLNGNTLAVTGTFTTLSGQTLDTTITSPTAVGHVTSTGAATINGGTLVHVDVDTSQYIANGTQFTVVAGTGGSGVATLTPSDITDNSNMLSFRQDTSNTASLVLDAVRTSLASFSTNANNANLGAMLDALGNGGDSTLQQIQLDLSNADSNTTRNNILSSLEPAVDQSQVTASANVFNNTMILTDTRLAALRDSDETGMAAGGGAAGLGVWGQAFGQHVNQDEKDGIAGYDANTWGGAFGLDTGNLADKAIIGLGFSYGRTNANGDGIGSIDTNVDSYQLSLYGNYNFSRQTYLDAMAAYGWNQDKTTRHDVGLLGTDASADFHSQQISAQAESGRHYEVGGGTILTPNVVGRWINYNPESYTETGTGGADLHVDGKTLNSLEAGVGVKAGWNFKNDNGSVFLPEIRTGYRYAIVDDKIEDTATFTGGGGTFETDGVRPGRNSLNLGTTLKYDTNTNWEFSASYEFDWKTNYTANTGFLQVSYKF